VALLVLQHIACEPPGVYEDVLVDRGIELERILLDDGDALPAWRRSSPGRPSSGVRHRGLAWAS